MPTEFDVFRDTKTAVATSAMLLTASSGALDIVDTAGFESYILSFATTHLNANLCNWIKVQTSDDGINFTDVAEEYIEGRKSSLSGDGFIEGNTQASGAYRLRVNDKKRYVRLFVSCPINCYLVIRNGFILSHSKDGPTPDQPA